LASNFYEISLADGNLPLSRIALGTESQVVVAISLAVNGKSFEFYEHALFWGDFDLCGQKLDPLLHGDLLSNTWTTV